MREGWQETTLGEIFGLANQRLGDHRSEPPVFAVSKYDGLVPASEYFGKRMASAKLDGYKVVEPATWVYSTIHIDEGSITRNSTDVTGVVSPMYTTMRFTSDRHDPRYFELLLRSPLAIQSYAENAQGTVNRRRSLSFKAFSKLKFLLPTLTEQQRIVDVIGAVDAYVAALESYATAARTARAALLHELLTTNTKGWKQTTLGEVLDRSIGGVWGSEVGTDEKDVTVVRSTEFAPSGNLGFSTGVPRSITAKQLQSRELRDGDILLEKSGGGPQQPVGRVVFVDATIPQFFVCSNFVQLLTPQRREAEPRFIFLMMWLWHFEGRTLEFQAHTTGIRNLRTQDYLGQAILLPPLTEQKRIVDVIGSVDEATAGADKAAEDARNLRSGLLSDLLSGDHEIPAGYDELLAAA